MINYVNFIVQFIDHSLHTYYRMSFVTIENLLAHETSGKLKKFTESNPGKLTQKERAITADWILRVCDTFRLTLDTFFQTVNMIDICIDKMCITRTNLQLYSIACLMIAAKKYERYAPEINDYVFIVDQQFDCEELLAAEVDTIKLLGFDIEIPNILEYNQCVRLLYREKYPNDTVNICCIPIMDHICMYWFHTYTSSTLCEVLPSVLSTATFYIAMSYAERLNFKESNVEIFNPFGVDEKVVLRLCASVVKLVLKFKKSTLRSVTNRLRNKICYEEFIAFIESFAGIILRLLEKYVDFEAPQYLKSSYTSSKITNLINPRECKRRCKLGKGTFGVVSKIECNGKMYAMKKSTCDLTNRNDEGLTAMFLREVSILLNVKHANIVTIIGVLDDCTGFVLELMDMNLQSFYIQNRNVVRSIDFQYKVTKDLLSGLEYMHSHGILNRDIKPPNILVRGEWGKNFEIKYCDFGLSRGMGAASTCIYATSIVCTLWYRPVELLLGSTNLNGPHIDVWSLVCTLFETFTRNALFKGKCEIDQLHSIFKVLGTPKPDHVLATLPGYNKQFPQWKYNFDVLYENAMDKKILNIIKDGLEYDPIKRATAKELLKRIEECK